MKLTVAFQLGLSTESLTQAHVHLGEKTPRTLLFLVSQEALLLAAFSYWPTLLAKHYPDATRLATRNTSHSSLSSTCESRCESWLLGLRAANFLLIFNLHASYLALNSGS